MKKILILDIETTGWLKDNGKIVELGIVELDLDTGERKIVFNELTLEKGMKKSEIENAWINKNSDISPDLVMQAESWDSILPKAQAIIDNYPLGCTAFNKSFDFTYLEKKGLKIRKSLPCLMLESTSICKLEGKYGKYKWPKVQEAYDHFFGKTDYIEKHRGGDDALHEAKIAYELYKIGKLTV